MNDGKPDTNLNLDALKPSATCLAGRRSYVRVGADLVLPGRLGDTLKLH